MRQKRTRAKLFGRGSCPRLSVFRSNRHVWAQIIDDESQKTLASSSDFKMNLPKTSKEKAAPEAGKKNESAVAKCAIAYEVGKEIARKAQALNIKEVIFDRGGCKYHGRVKGLAEGARSAGLKF